jgi:hypothetical protein
LLAIIGSSPSYDHWTQIFAEESFKQPWLNELVAEGYLKPFGTNHDYFAVTGVAEGLFKIPQYRTWIRGLQLEDTRGWPLMDDNI